VDRLRISPFGCTVESVHLTTFLRNLPLRRHGRAAALAAIGTLLIVPSALGATANFNGTATYPNPPTSYPISVSMPGQISATLSWSTNSALLTLSIVDPNGTQVASDTTSTNPKTLNFTATQTGTYKVRVKAKTGSSNYSLSVSYPGTPTPTYAGQIGGGSQGHATMYPGGVTVGPDGTIYVADTGNDQVEAYNGTTGALIWTTTGTRGSKSAGSFNNPRDIAYLNGQLYVDDTGNNRVQVLNAANGAATSWSYHFPSTLGISAGKDGNGNNIILVSEDTSNQIAVFTTTGSLECTITGPAGTLSGPRDAATNAAGDVYVADYAHDRIVEFGPPSGGSCSQTVLRTWGTHGSLNGQFLRPYGIDLDSSGNVYVADSVNDRVQKFDGTGQYLATYGAPVGSGGDLQFLRRVAVANGAVYAADLWGFHIDRFSTASVTPAQTYPNVIGTPQTGYFNEPSGLTFDSSGTMDVADSVNQRIQPFTPGANGTTWTASTPWGARGWGVGDLSGFNWPRDITYAASSNTLWVADTKNDRLLQFDTGGNSTSAFIGSKTTLNWPYGIQADGTQLVVADTYKNQIESWNTDGTPHWSVSSANGITFNKPYQATVVNGVVYVADSGNKRIVELNSSTGAVLGWFGTGTLHSPFGVAIDPVTGNIWVTDTSYNRLVEFDSTGNYIQAFGKLGSGNGQFNRPTHLAFHQDAGGHVYLYVCDTYNDRIEIIDPHDS
jgi:tripartite motif-containing protein 71